MVDELLEIEEKEEVKTTYLEEIEKIRLNNSETKKIISVLDLMIRDFLIKKYHIKRESEYDELTDYFLEKNKPEVATLCHYMVESLYGGNKVTKQKIDIILENFKLILVKEQEVKKKYSASPLSSIINKLKIWKDKNKNKKRIGPTTQYLSRQTKRFIELELANYETLDDQKTDQKIEEPDKNPSPILIPSLETDEDNSMPAEHKLIEHIDSLERIRKKIQEKKKNLSVQPSQKEVR